MRIKYITLKTIYINKNTNNPLISIEGCWSSGAGECGCVWEHSHTDKGRGEGRCGMGVGGGGDREVRYHLRCKRMEWLIIIKEK